LEKQTKVLVSFLTIAVISISHANAYNENYNGSANYKNETKTNLIVPINNSNSITQDNILSPKKQTDQGVPPLGVICKFGFQLVLKASDGSPACVNPSSVDKLVARGWAQSQDWRNHD
jgi:hypothetical protein